MPKGLMMFPLVLRLTERRRKLLVSSLGFLISACTVHPLPEDVTGLSTYNIVRQIRCETREAVIGSILRYLTDKANFEGLTPDGKRKVDDNSHNIGLKFANEYRSNPSSISTFNPNMLSGFAQTVISLLWNVGIAYNFNLQMKDMNNIDPEVDLLRMFHSSKQTYGLKGNLDRSRQNIRYFTITDNFADLVQKVDPRYCAGQIVEANIIYPIAGQVGMNEVVHDFLVLTLFGNLSGDASKDVTSTTSTKGPPTMVEQLQFITSVGGTATPMVTFTPVGAGTVVSPAMLGLTASRSDTHSLTVGLYLAEPGVKVITDARPGIMQGALLAAPGEHVDSFLSLITARGGPAEQGAANAINQFQTLRQFQQPQ